MARSLAPSSVAVLSTAAYEHRPPRSPDDDYHEDDGFEFTPLLLRPPPRRRGARTERPRTAHATPTPTPPPPPQRARRAAPTSVAAAAALAPATTTTGRKVRWHDMAFGSARVPAAMDMGEIRRRLRARQAAAGTTEPSAPAGWAPWRLIRSLSCKGVEAVAAAAAPVRLV